MKLVEDLTRVGNKDCIRFVPKTFEKTYIRIYSGGGCSSFVRLTNLSTITKF